MAKAKAHEKWCECRREFLQKAGLSLSAGFFGLNLLNMSFLREAYGVTPDATTQRYDSIIQIFYNGGPSQTDTWDPKPGSNSNVFNTINTGAQDIYGNTMRVSDCFPNLVGLLSDPAFGMGLVRSMSHGNGSHSSAQEWMNCMWQSPVASVYPSTASSFAHLFKEQGTEIPASVLVNGSNGNAANTAKGGETPAAFQVFSTNSATQMLSRPSNVNQARYDLRKRLLDAFNTTYVGSRPDPEATAWEGAVKQAYDVTTAGKASTAFDLNGVPTLPGGGNARGSVLTGLTLAQRLVENGVPYVTLAMGGNDTHSNNMSSVRRNWADSTDVPLAQLAQNLKSTGKRVLVVMGGEFGRTPASVLSNGTPRDGRDHWADGFSWGMFSINQPAFRTTAVGDTGPDGLFRVRNNNLVDPVSPSALGALMYRAMGFPIGTGAQWNVPTAIGSRPPVDQTIANATTPGGGTWLMQQFNLL